MSDFTEEQLQETTQQDVATTATEEVDEKTELARQATLARLSALGFPDPKLLYSPLTLFNRIGNLSMALSLILSSYPTADDANILSVLAYSSVVEHNRLRSPKLYLAQGDAIEYSAKTGEILRITHEGQHIEGEALKRVTGLARRYALAVVQGKSCYLLLPTFQFVNHHESTWLILENNASKEVEVTPEVKAAATAILQLIAIFVEKSTDQRVLDGVVALSQAFRDWTKDRQSSVAEEWPSVKGCIAACTGMVKMAAIMQDEGKDEVQMSRAGRSVCEIAEFISISISESAKIVEWFRRCKSKTKIRTILSKMNIRLPVFANPSNKPAVQEGVEMTVIEIDRAAPNDFILLEKQKASAASISTLLDNPNIKVYTFKNESVKIAVGGKAKKKNSQTSKKSKVVNYITAATKPVSFFQAIRYGITEPGFAVPQAQLPTAVTTALSI